MKGIFKKLLIVGCFFFSSVLSANSSFSVLFEQNKKILDELDYYKSDEISIYLNGKRLYLNWGSIGHGDILQPFMGVKPRVEEVESLSDSSNEDEFGTISVGKKIAKIVLKNQIKKIVGQNLDDFLEKLPSFLRWIVEKIVRNGQLSPVEEFILRSYILYKTPFDNDKQDLKTAEFTALLFKLALTEGQDVFVKNGSSLLNSEMIRELLGQDFIDFSTDILSSFQNGFQDCDFDSFGRIVEQDINSQHDSYKVGYVFRDLGLAKQCYSLFYNEKYSEKEFKKIIDGFIQNLTVNDQDIWSNTGYETISLDNFKEYETSTLGNFVGCTSDSEKILNFVTENNTGNVLELESEKSSNVYLVSNQSEHWVVLKTQTKGSNLNLERTVKFTIAAIYKAFQDYNLIKTETDGSSSISSNVSVLTDKELIKSKRQLERLLNTKNYLIKELESLNLKIKETKSKLNESSSLWNNFFHSTNEDQLRDILKKREKIEIRFSKIETEIRELNVGLYYLTAPERLQGLADKGVFSIISDMFLSNPKVQEFIKDINQNPKYKLVKENLIKHLAKIFGQSDYVKEYWEVIEEILSHSLPNYKNDFKMFTQNLNDQDTDIGDMVLSFIGF